MKNIDEKIKELQQLKVAKENAYKQVINCIQSIEVDKRIASDWKSFKKCVFNAIKRRIDISIDEPEEAKADNEGDNA